MPNLIDQARLDIRAILNGEFSTELTITPTGGEPVIIKGIATRHSQVWDTDGLPIISENAHCSFYEKDLNDLEITTRGAKNELIIKNWKVKWTDSIGENSYKISEPAPDRTLGCIRTTLSILNE